MTRRLAWALAAALVLVPACSGGSRGEERLVGSWESARGEVIEFTREGSVHTRDGTNRQNGHWESIAPGRIRIRWNGTDGVTETAVTFTDEGDLVLPDVAPSILYAPSR